MEGIPVSQWVDFIERLYTAKRKIDKRISKLGGDSAGFAVSWRTLQVEDVSGVALTGPLVVTARTKHLPPRGRRNDNLLSRHSS